MWCSGSCSCIAVVVVAVSCRERPKVVRACAVFNMFTSKWPSCHKASQSTFSTSQLPKVVRDRPAYSGFKKLDFEMCFVPQRRAFLEHLNFQKCSGNGALCTSKCVLHHNCVNFLNISTDKIVPNPQCF